MWIGGLFHPEYYAQMAPFVIAISLAVFSLFFEDVALLIGIALTQLNAALLLPVLLGLMCGFLMGDMLIYSAGRWLQHLSWVARRINGPSTAARIRQLRGRIIPALFICRMIPASRLPTFIAAGVLKVPTLTYFGISMISASLWIGVTVLAGVNILRQFEAIAGFSSAWLLIPMIGVLAYTLFRQPKAGAYAA